MTIQNVVIPAEKIGEDVLPPDLSTAKELYEIASTLALGDMCLAEVLAKILEKLDAKKEELAALLRTAKLWTDYMNMLDVLHQFLRAKRIGDWNLHLQSVRDILSYFAVSEHSLYTKSAYVYLQTMLELLEIHPDVHKRFEEGHHVIRRTDCYWSGLSTNLTLSRREMLKHMVV